MIWSKRKSKKTFYACYKEKKKQTLSNEASESVPEKEKKVRVKKEKPVNEQKMVKKEFIPNRSIVISVSSLRTGIGCSHICNLLKSYIKSKNHTAIILRNNDNVFDYFDKYHFIISDYGNVGTGIGNEYRLSDIKIMVCILDDIYLKELNEQSLSPDKWYFFNHVPAEMKGRVADYMEDYNYYCVPVCVPEFLNKEIKREFAKVIKI